MRKPLATLALGTAGLAQRYAGEDPPSRKLALSLLFKAVREGARIIDTAPAYQTEDLVGIVAAAAPNVLVATKVSATFGARRVAESLETSRRLLQREALDVVQLHNPTVADLTTRAFALDALREAQARRVVSAIGASVYTVPEAIAAIKSARVDVLQVPYNLIDQRMARLGLGLYSVFEYAQRFGVTLLARSPWLRGALTGFGVRFAPPRVRAAVVRASRCLLRPRDLGEVALRFALDGPDSVVVGVRSAAEWDAAVAAAGRGLLPWWQRVGARWCASLSPDVVDVRRWPEPHYVTPFTLTAPPEDAA